MIGVDTNILVYAHRRESIWHEPARRVIQHLAEGRSPWAIAWPSIYEFLSKVTHPRIFDPPSSSDEALRQVGSWMESPSLVLLAEPVGFYTVLNDILRATAVIGPVIHDARIAALCHYHGVDRLYTADRDFSRFANYLRVENPLLAQ